MDSSSNPDFGDSRALISNFIPDFIPYFIPRFNPTDLYPKPNPKPNSFSFPNRTSNPSTPS
jgi:hypothetical protein